jgi:hypothetical protein
MRPRHTKLAEGRVIVDIAHPVGGIFRPEDHHTQTPRILSPQRDYRRFMGGDQVLTNVRYALMCFAEPDSMLIRSHP